MLWALPAGLAVAGAFQGEQKRKQNERDNQAQAEVARWSPWTGMAPREVKQNDNWMSGAMQGGVAGLGMGQNLSSDGSLAKAGAPDSGASLADDAAAPAVEPEQTGIFDVQDPYKAQGAPSLYEGMGPTKRKPSRWDNMA